MKIQVETDKSSELTTFTIKGELDFNEFLAFIETHHAQPDHKKRCLWDFSAITGGESVSVLQMGRFYGLCSEHFYGKSAHKIAFVVSNEIGYGFAQVMSTFEELYDVYLNVRAFNNLQDAMDWLAESSE